MSIKNISNLNYRSINKKATVDEALKLMNDLNVNGMPVLDDDDKLVGIIVKADAYRFLTKPGHYVDYPVELIMSTNVITAEANEDILDVAKKLRKHDIIAMPIIENDKVVGIVTIEDLIDYFIDNN